jgi:hypothetical protein
MTINDEQAMIWKEAVMNSGVATSFCRPGRIMTMNFKKTEFIEFHVIWLTNYMIIQFNSSLLMCRVKSQMAAMSPSSF